MGVSPPADPQERCGDLANWDPALMELLSVSPSFSADELLMPKGYFNASGAWRGEELLRPGKVGSMSCRNVLEESSDVLKCRGSFYSFSVGAKGFYQSSSDLHSTYSLGAPDGRSQPLVRPADWQKVQLRCGVRQAQQKEAPQAVVIYGPAGAGKSTVRQRLEEGLGNGLVVGMLFFFFLLGCFL